MALRLLRNASSVEAAIIRSRLRAEGLCSFVFGADESPNATEHVGASVMVAEEDFEAARAILAEEA
jgi:hypothetical protein